MAGVLTLTQACSVGYGIQEPFIPANPAAGANFVFNCDGRGLRRLLSIVYTVTLANAGANRLVTLECRGKDALPFLVSGPAQVQTIATATRYVADAWRGLSDFNTGTDTAFGLAPVFLFPGDSLNIIIASINGSDAITNIRGIMERFPLDPADLAYVRDH